MDRVAVYCGTRNLYRDMQTAAKSLLYHNRMDRVYFITEDSEHPDLNGLPDIFTVINVSGQQYFDPSGPNYASPWSYMAYIRLALCKILPDVHRILYLDADTVVLDDISPLLDMDMTGKLFAMVREDVGEITMEQIKAFSVSGDTLVPFQTDSARPPFPVRPYYNSCVMLMNLDEFKRDGTDDRLIEELNTVKHAYPDQDIVNIFCAGRIVTLPQEYNVIPAIVPDFPLSEIKIRHFASDKPVWKHSVWQKYRKMSWQEVMERKERIRTAQNGP